jgi:hypothetical protein
MLDNNAGLQLRRVGMYHVYLAESKYSDLTIIMTLIFTNGKVYHGYFTVRTCLKVLEDTSFNCACPTITPTCITNGEILNRMTASGERQSTWENMQFYLITH